MTKTYIMNGLIEKMKSSDQDFRYMGLNDLMLEIKNDSGSFLGDETVELKVLEQVLTLVEDKISEVKNQAVKCLGQLIKIMRESQMVLVVDRLIQFSSSKDDELRDISGLALKTITAELPQEGSTTTKACEKLAPKLLAQLSNSSIPPETTLETLSILSILITRFSSNLASLSFNPPPITILTQLLWHPRSAVRKRAIITLAQFLPISQSEHFNELLKGVILPNLAPNTGLEKQRTTVQLVAAVTRYSTRQIAPTLHDLIPPIIKAVNKDDEELREGGLQALETLVLRCPTEVTPFLGNIIQIATQLIKYDPNYAGDVEDEDEEMADEEEEEDAELDETYEDDEDTSYKIRRSATKVLAAIIATRPELLVTLYKDISPVLISRFGDREETVRVEVWATYRTLLTQTCVYSGTPQARDAEYSTGGKRKRDESMDVESDGPLGLLSKEVPKLAKALLNQLKSPKTAALTLQQGYNVLITLLATLPGSLSKEAPQIISNTKAVLSQSSNSSSSALQITVLSFLSTYFSTHPPSSFSSSLNDLLPVLLKTAGERHPRLSSESFRVFSSLLNSLKPLKSGATWVDRVYDESVRRLINHDTDAEVRDCAEETIGNIWIYATEIAQTKDRKEWEAMLRTTGRFEGPVKVVTKVASEVETIGDQWVNGSIEWVLTLLKRSGRSSKGDIFVCLESLLRRYSVIPADLPSTIVSQLKPYISTGDIFLLAKTLDVFALLLELSPSDTFPEVERELLPSIYTLPHSSLISGAPFDSVLGFFASLVQADMQIATHVVPNLVISTEKAPKGETSLGNVAKCIGQVVKCQQTVAAGTIAEFARHLKSTSKAKPTQIVLSLLVVGEIGRFIDLSPQQEIFNASIEHFASEQEEIRTAAAFAAGNIAVGNLHHFLPVLVKMVERDTTKRLLSLHALKEVVTHCSHSQLESVADMLWGPLFQNSENAEETVRNVSAACLGKLATTHPAKYLPQLHEPIKDPNAASRATVLAAIRYTFAETTRGYDEHLAPIIMDFLSLINDSDLNVRRLALSALNTAARVKAHLIRDQLSLILPGLYQETVVKAELIRIVDMGPWKHKVDDGLEARKTAYETLYTLLDTCLSKLDLHEFLSRILVGLNDDSNEIKVIVHMTLHRLSQVAPTAVAQRLDDITPSLQKSMKGATVTKDTVKQDLERAAELQRSTLRAVAALSKTVHVGQAVKFDAFVEELRRSPEWSNEFQELLGA